MIAVTRSPLAGVELAYAEITANQSGITGVANVTGLSITFTVGARPVMVKVHIGIVQQTVANGNVTVTITDGSDVQKAACGALVVAAAFDGPYTTEERISTPGSYTRKVRAVTDAGSLLIGAAANNRAFIQALTV